MLFQDLLTRHAADRPDHPMCICGDRRIAYAELEQQSNRLAHALREAGIQRGDRVVAYLENSIELVVAAFAILKAGAGFVLVNASTKADKLCFMLNDCTARAVILPARASEAIAAIAAGAPSVGALVLCGPPPRTPSAEGEATFSGQTLSFERDVPTFPDSAPPRLCIDMDLSAIVYTSGSTGRPKGVTALHSTMLAAVDSITQYLENVPEDVVLSVLPLSFTYGLYQLLASVKMGSTLVLERSLAYPYQIVQRIPQHGVTGMPGVPTVWGLILQMKDLKAEDFASVRYITNAGAAMPPAYIARLRSLFTHARVFLMHGLTECVRTTYLPPEEIERRPTSVGRGMPNVELDVVDEQGAPVKPGEVGELTVRGANVMRGYWNRPEETAKALRPGRYPWERVLYSGDLFTKDEEGFLYFVSRQDDIIKSRGEKVSPLEVEHAICELASVKEVAVIGVPDDLLGQAIKAFVVPAEGAALAEGDIIGHCQRRLENFMVPKYVEFVEGLPKTDSGKIRRAALKPGGA